MRSNQWFEVDKEGLRQLLQDRGPWLVLRELIQNAWDEPGVTHCQVHLESTARGRASLVVEDDAPEGFHDLSHAYTLYAHTRKREDAEKRGRFNLGEKQVLSLCECADIVTTTGHVIFREDGKRTTGKQRRKSGSVFHALIRMTKHEVEKALAVARTFLPPKHIRTTINGEDLPCRLPLATFETPLETEIWRDGPEGLTRTTTRRVTVVEVHEAYDGETPMVYEMGLPVVETGDKWHYNIMQRVPLTTSRDNVKAAWLRDVRAEVLNHMAQELDDDESSERWVRDGAADDRISTGALGTIADKRWGPKRCVLNPNDPRSREQAIVAGYAIVSPRDMSKAEWEQARRAEVIPSASQLFPTSFTEADIIPPEKWTPNQRSVADLAGMLFSYLFPHDFGHVTVVMMYVSQASIDADYRNNDCTLRFNTARLVDKWFHPENVEAQIALIIHELCHRFGGHFDKAYLDGLSMCAAKLALTDPKIFLKRKVEV
jgi:hypothetical protein